MCFEIHKMSEKSDLILYTIFSMLLSSFTNEIKEILKKKVQILFAICILLHKIEGLGKILRGPNKAKTVQIKFLPYLDSFTKVLKKQFYW